jgi:hypothetical protein
MIMRAFARFLLLLGLLLAPQSGRAFSLLGEFDPGPPDSPYQTPDLGYGIGIIISSREQDLGGPQNLEEEYRWASPLMVYGFDRSFIEYFGPGAVDAVDAAFKMLNDFPRASALSPQLTEFPLETARFNYTAQQLRIIDLKSLVLSVMLEQMGIASPERYAYTLRARTVLADDVFYTVAQRNFDPVPLNPADPPHLWRFNYTPYINGTLYSYLVRDHRPINGLPQFFDAQELAVDVGNPRVSVASYAGLQAGLVDPRVANQLYGTPLAPGAGLFFTGLTRDDAGALRYLLHPGRSNIEFAPPGSFRGLSVTTPTVVDNRRQGSPWQIYVPVGVTLTNGTGGGGGGGVIISNTPLVEPLSRPGVDKVSFVRLDVDSFLGRFLDPLVIRYSETGRNPLTGQLYTQSVQRSLSAPDILFTADDLGVTPNNGRPYVFSRNLSFQNNGDLNTFSTINIPNGPGNVLPGEVSFNKVGPWVLNVGLTAEERGRRGFMLGRFDGTTNAPVVFPQNVDIYEIERRLLGRN